MSCEPLIVDELINESMDALLVQELINELIDELSNTFAHWDLLGLEFPSTSCPKATLGTKSENAAMGTSMGSLRRPPDAEVAFLEINNTCKHIILEGWVWGGRRPWGPGRAPSHP